MIVLLVLSLGTASLGYQQGSLSNNTTTIALPATRKLNSMAYVPNSTISINSNDDFSTLGFNGSGTLSDPYLIERFNITSSDDPSIEISNTDAYFRISNCSLEGEDAVILLNNVTHAQLSDNKITDGAIVLEVSTDNMISGNMITNDMGLGIYLTSSGNNSFVDNILVNNVLIIDADILEDYLQAEVTNNTVYGKKMVYWEDVNGGTVPSDTGQVILVNCDSIEVSGQDIVSIQTMQSSNLIIQDNTAIPGFNIIILYYSSSSTILNNHGFEITLAWSENSIINSNTVDGVSGFAITLAYSGNSTLMDNIVTNIQINEEGDDIAIFVYYSGNTTLNNNNVDNSSSRGIGIVHSENCSLTGNSVTNSSGDYGIFLADSGNSNLISNLVTKASGEHAIFLYESQNNNLSSNTVKENYGNGIVLDNSGSSTFVGNVVSRNEENGIWLWMSGNNKFFGNTLDNNNAGFAIGSSNNNIWNDNTVSYCGTAFYTHDSSNNNIADNIISKNYVGIYLNPLSYENKIQNNSFYGLNFGDSQATDDGERNSFMFNYWDDWTGPDADPDGVVDELYLLDGDANNKDPYPLVNPGDVPHLIVGLNVIYPSNGENLKNTITIIWEPAIDSFNHFITYSVYYSYDDGTTWVEDITDLVTESYEWDTTAVNDGDYVIKIVAVDTEGMIMEVISSSLTIENIVPTTSDPTTTSDSTTSSDSTITSDTTTSDSKKSSGSTINVNFKVMILGLITFMIVRSRSKKGSLR
jgi:parallel beta-helix repeat protein